MVLALTPASVQAEPLATELGIKAGSTAGAGSAVTGQKAESKLWQQGGYWWAVMVSGTAYSIHRLNESSRIWIDTGVTVDNRLGTRADALPSGDSLYIASHVFSSSNTSGNPALSRLYKYDYDAPQRTYLPAQGYPVVIGDTPAEVLTIAEDSTGRLWTTWVRNGTVKYTHSLESTLTWSTPISLTSPTASNLPADDVAAIVSMGDRVGIMWSNQSQDLFGFAEHLDTDPPHQWTTRNAITSPWISDDHLSLTTDPAQPGRVLAAAKTNLDINGGWAAAQIVLLERDPDTGTWTQHAVSTVADCHTRPVVTVDESSREVHVFATGPTGGGCPYTGYPGTIYRKSASLDTLTFPSGRGIPVLRAANVDDMNNVSIAKGPANANSGLVVLASSDADVTYRWAGFGLDEPTPTPTPTPTTSPTPTASPTTSPTPTASPTTSPTPTASPTAPTAGFTTSVTVQFASTSTAHDSVAWDFGDGTTSTETNPTHTYAAPGRYTITQTVTSPGGTATASTIIEVGPVASR